MPESGEYNGVIPSVLGELHDVARTAPVDGDTLVWNATAGRWEPGAAQSGTSVPASWMLTFAAAQLVFTANGDSQTILWDTPPDLLVGADIGVDGAGLITFSTAGTYVITFEFDVSSDAADGVGFVWTSLNTSSVDDDNHPWNTGNGIDPTVWVDYTAMGAGLSSVPNASFTTPPLDFAAGDNFSLFVAVSNLAGTLKVGGSVHVRRTA